MTYVPKSSPMLQALQDKIEKQIKDREEAIRNYTPSLTVIKHPKGDIRKEPTLEDILLMDEYSRGVYQGD